MNRDNMQPIDELIDSALRSESQRDVPQGFRNRVMERISAEAHQSELAATNRHRLVRPALFLGVLVAAMIVVPMASFYGQWTRQALPGGLGLLDYALAWIDLSRMGSLSDFTFTAASVILAGAAIIVAAWAVTRARSARRQAER